MKMKSLPTVSGWKWLFVVLMPWLMIMIMYKEPAAVASSGQLLLRSDGYLRKVQRLQVNRTLNTISSNGAPSAKMHILNATIAAKSDKTSTFTSATSKRTPASITISPVATSLSQEQVDQYLDARIKDYISKESITNLYKSMLSLSSNSDVIGENNNNVNMTNPETMVMSIVFTSDMVEITRNLMCSLAALQLDY